MKTLKINESKMIIRQEEPKDFGRIYELVKVAFQTAKVSSGEEQDLVTRLRAGNKYIPELALVAEEDGRVIGHIMLTKMYVHGDDGKKHETLLVAPLAVELECRYKGIGSALVKESLWVAAELGYGSVFLVGDPKYYRRFGFRSAKNFGITHPGIPDEYVMVCELIHGALKGIHGTVDCRGLDE